MPSVGALAVAPTGRVSRPPLGPRPVVNAKSGSAIGKMPATPKPIRAARTGVPRFFSARRMSQPTARAPTVIAARIASTSRPSHSGRLDDSRQPKSGSGT